MDDRESSRETDEDIDFQDEAPPRDIGEILYRVMLLGLLLAIAIGIFQFKRVAHESRDDIKAEIKAAGDQTKSMRDKVGEFLR